MTIRMKRREFMAALGGAVAVPILTLRAARAAAGDAGDRILEPRIA